MALFSPMSKHRAADTGMIDEWRSQIEEIVTKGGNEDAVGTDEPKRNTAVWLMMGAGRRKGQWRKMYPLRMGEDDEWFEAMETRNHEIARKVRVKLIPFELILQLKEDKGEKMTTLGSSVRQACTSFMHDIVEQPRTLGAFAAFYSALLCAVSVVAMLAPGGVSLAIAWGVVGCASVGGYLVVRRRHFTSSDASDDARSGGVNSTADIIWANFSVIKGIWASLLLLVLAPTTLMTLPDSVTASIDSPGGTPNMIARLGGLLFLTTLWSLGWAFLWLQNSGGGVLARCETYLMSTSSSTQVRREVLEHVQECEADGTTPIMVPRPHAAVYIKSRDSSEPSGWRKVFPHRCCYSIEDRQMAEFEALEEITTQTGTESRWMSVIVRFCDVDIVDSLDKTTSDSKGLPFADSQSLQHIHRVCMSNHTDQTIKAFERDTEGGGTRLKPTMRPVKDQMAMMTDLPPGWKMRLKLYTLLYEGYVYSGFSFFPALPWQEVEIPPQLPDESLDVMRWGILELSGQSTHYFTFVGAVLFVPLSFLLLYLSRNKIERYLLVTEIAFSAMTFAVVKQMTDVFSCTAAGKESVIDGRLTRLCAPDIVAACMDSVPDIECWQQEHYVHILCAMGALIPYYIGSLWLRTESQSKSSVIVVDGLFAIVAFQLKMFLAVLASLFGDCYPLIILASVEVAVIAMMAPYFLQAGRRYSNVVQLNVARLGGLVIAAINGLYAFYITAAHKPPDGTWSTCTGVIESRDHRHDHRELSSTLTNVSNSTISGGSVEPGSLFEFAVLVVLNVGGVLFFWWWFHRLAVARSKEFAELQVGEASEREVDYPIILFRLLHRAGVRAQAKRQSFWAFCGAGKAHEKVERSHEATPQGQDDVPFKLWLAEDRAQADREEGH